MIAKMFHELISFFPGDKEKPNLRLVYIFGSRVSGNVGPLSDYDFAILFSQDPEAGGVCALKHRIAGFLGTDRIDLVVLNRAPVELKYNVVTTGKVLYEESRKALVEFEARTLSSYFDSLPVLRRHRKELLEERNHEAGVRRYRAALGKTQELLDKITASSEKSC